MIFPMEFIRCLNFNLAEAKVSEISPHIFVNKVEPQDWFLNVKSEIIFAGCGSPIFPNKRTYYLDYKTIKYGTLKDGRFIITCNFYGMMNLPFFTKATKTMIHEEPDLLSVIRLISI